MSYCVTRGCYASGKHLIKLAKPCEKPTQHGRYCLEAFKADRCPPGLSSWPMGMQDTKKNAPVDSQVQSTEQSTSSARERVDNVYTRVRARLGIDCSVAEHTSPS